VFPQRSVAYGASRKRLNWRLVSPINPVAEVVCGAPKRCESNLISGVRYIAGISRIAIGNTHLVIGSHPAHKPGKFVPLPVAVREEGHQQQQKEETRRAHMSTDRSPHTVRQKVDLSSFQVRFLPKALKNNSVLALHIRRARRVGAFS
jgi:hypothetical protein